MVNVGGIVSVGGGVATGGGGSGIQSLNAQTGPAIVLNGANGIEVLDSATNVITIDGAALSGFFAASLSSGCYAASFGPTTSGQFQHNLGTRDILVQISDDSAPPQFILPDAITYDTLDTISVLFNRPQSGRVVIVSCGSIATTPGSTGTSERVELDLAFKETFNSNTYSEVTRTSGQISQIDIWEDSLKSDKLFTKTIARVSGQISQVVITDDQVGSTLTTDIGRDVSGVLTTITKTFVA
jgi:hypothetical protein